MIYLGDTRYPFTSFPKASGVVQSVDESTMISAIIAYFGLEAGSSVRFAVPGVPESPDITNLKENGERYDYFSAFNGDYSTYTYNSETGYYSFIKNTN